MKILVADDDVFYRRLLQGILNRWGYSVITAADGNSALRLLSGEDAPRLAIINWLMPGRDGVDVCREVRNRSVEAYVYLILLTAKNQKMDVVAGLKSEADDYLTKPFDVGELHERLRSGTRILNLQSRLVSRSVELRRQAAHDSLTNLWNHGGILGILRREAARSVRRREPLSLAMADIDHFKRVNDIYGHASGDIVLREAAARMQAAVRPYDAIGRYGGEEFMIVMPGADSRHAMLEAERLRKIIARNPFDCGGRSIAITISIGVAGHILVIPKDVEALVAAADEALYRAKAEGRNRVELQPASGDLKNPRGVAPELNA